MLKNRGKEIFITVLGIIFILAIAYLLIKYLGLIGGILIIVVIAWSSFINERHNPIILYYKNIGKTNKKNGD